ncbi:MAG: hypothetical protein WBB78_01310 [Propionicimonas sp.]
MDDDEDDDFTPWTEDGAKRVRRAADALTDAIRVHAAAVTRVTSDADEDDVRAAGYQLLPAILAYADAQFDYSGTSFPFGALYEYTDDDHEEEDLGEGPRTGVSILQRRDFPTTDEQSVMEAGRQAYREVSGEAEPDAAAAEVSHLGVALYEIGHARGWDSLEQLDGLTPRGSVALVLASEDLLGSDPDEWPEEDLFAHDEERLLYRQDDVYGE